MPKVFIILALVTCSIFGWMFYQYKTQQSELGQLKEYQQVLYQNAESIYAQAQDWTQPIHVNILDQNLQGDYKIMANFILNDMIQNAEARNQYLRELKAIHWDNFLNIERLDRDRSQNFIETQRMLAQAHVLANQYQQQIKQHQELTLEQSKKLNIKPRLKYQLAESLDESRNNDQTHTIFALELQILRQADALFELLKNSQWQKKGRTFMFYEDASLKQFNVLYQQVLQLNAEIDKVKKQNRKAVEQQF